VVGENIFFLIFAYAVDRDDGGRPNNVNSFNSLKLTRTLVPSYS
jgi:hypothetical protein